MRSVEEFLRQAADFALLSGQSKYPAPQKRFADFAACYRLLADERRRLIEEGGIANENGLLDQSGQSPPA